MALAQGDWGFGFHRPPCGGRVARTPGIMSRSPRMPISTSRARTPTPWLAQARGRRDRRQLRGPCARWAAREPRPASTPKARARLATACRAGRRQAARPYFGARRRRRRRDALPALQRRGRRGHSPASKASRPSIVRPSLVLGAGGASGDFFSALAALPVPPRLGDGDWRVQPLHVSANSAELIARLALDPAPPAQHRCGRPARDHHRRTDATACATGLG